jgi:uncharacterized protein
MTMQNKEKIRLTIDFVKTKLQGAEGGHDWWHIYRVWNNAKQLAKTEGGNLLVIELATLLHDIADSKFHGGDETLGPKIAREYIVELGITDLEIEQIVTIIENLSFKGGHASKIEKTIEFEIVQDADRLDAIGAIGIARTFNYGGFKNREMYNPEITPNLTMTKEEYKNSTTPTLNHFYEKLLLLKDLMNTNTARMMAEQRHRFMETYLEQFYKEWDGER